MTKSGYIFGGWYTNSGLTSAAVFPVTNVTESKAFYAKWIPVFTVTFNANGGTVTPASGSTRADSTLASLPVPARANYAFNGWFTAETGGTEVTVGRKYSANTVIYAHWTTPPISVASPSRVIPQPNSSKETVVVAPVNQLSAEFTAGPNPVGKSSGVVKFFRQGSRIASAPLLVIYDASGNMVRKVGIADKAAACGSDRRAVGSWNLKDAKGRSVPAGTYLVKGVVKTANGKREKVSVVVGVR
jgi:uncharacterized repeat protein (TIGR02543 family)